MSAPVRGRRPSRFTFNMPSPKPVKQPKQWSVKLAQHPAPPPSILARKLDTARRRRGSTPHPINTHKPIATPNPRRAVALKAAFIDHSLSLQFSPSFSPSSCVISDVPVPATPTDSPISDMPQQRWSGEQRRDSTDDAEQAEEAEGREEQDMFSPNCFSSSECSTFSPIDSASSLDTPVTSPLANIQPPLPTFSAAPPHRRIHSDPLPASSTLPVFPLALKLKLRPLIIPASKSDESIYMLSALSPIPLDTLMDRQPSYECDEASSSAAQAVGGSAVSELLRSRPMSLAECWYGRSELMSPVSDARMMSTAAQQNKAGHMPFNQLYCRTADML